MTGFSGIYVKQGVGDISADWKSEVRMLLSRFPGEPISEFVSEKFYLATYDIGAYDSPSFVELEDGRVAKLAGQAYVDGENTGGRWRDVCRLIDSLTVSSHDALVSARGTFCGVFYDPNHHKLILFTDVVGVRPVYFSDCGSHFVFSTSFRVLSSVSFLARSVDELGAIERGFLGYSLGSKTTISEVSVTRPAEIVSVQQERVHRDFYDSLAGYLEHRGQADQLVRQVYDAFVDSVSLRLSGHKHAFSLLSGGLDSRLIVAALRELGADVDSYCMSVEGQQEYEFSRLFAESVGAKHHVIKEEDGFRHNSSRLKMYADQRLREGAVETAHALWSGDGGSVGLGFVYFDDVVRFESGFSEVSVALREMAKEKSAKLNCRFMKGSECELLRKKLFEDLFYELFSMGDEGVGRNLRMYYFSNDQRRHLFDSIEDIDIHRVEFIVPFFDSVLIKLMASIPIKLGLRHGFYMDVVGEFPAVVSSVPWQAYPNHAPCPIPIPHGLLYQWDQSSPESMSARKEARETILRVVSGRRFPSLYSRSRMFVLAVLEYFKLSRRSYVFQPFLSLARAIDVENKK